LLRQDHREITADQGQNRRYGVGQWIGTVRCVGGIKFVATPNPSQLLIITNGIVDGERKVTRYPEDVVHTKVMQTGKYVLYYGLSMRHVFSPFLLGNDCVAVSPVVRKLLLNNTKD